MLVPGVGRPRWRTRGGGEDGGGGGARVMFMTFVHVYFPHSIWLYIGLEP